MRRRSIKAERVHRTEYLPLVKRLLEEDPWCAVGPRIYWGDPTWGGCAGRASGLHHLRKRTPANLCDEANVMRCCNPCNEWVENWPILARQLGLVLRSDDNALDDYEGAP